MAWARVAKRLHGRNRVAAEIGEHGLVRISTLHALALAVLVSACGTDGPALRSETQLASGPAGTVSGHQQAGPPRFHASISRIDPAAADRMTSWRPGCPVAVSDLRLVTVSHWTFAGRAVRGRLVVNRDAAGAIVGVMRRLFAAHFPIQRMRPVEAYGSDDERSMAANNTSAFNCRRVAGSSSWSQHAYGRAIDINPLQNPEVSGGLVSPPGGARYLDRSQKATGLIHAGDVVVTAFARAGWSWGGYWRSLKDYQHFSANGR
jgi:hypothetical protein